MKILTTLLLTSWLGLAAGGAFAHEHHGSVQAQEDGFYCNLDALDDAQKKRVVELLQNLRHGILAHKELPDGYEFKFAGSIASVKDVGEWVAYERSCCKYLTFEIRAPRDADAVWLRLTGKPGVKDLLREEFDLK